MSYFGVSTRNGVGLGLGTVPSLTNTPLGYRLAPSLNLSFAGSDTLSPAITFSRTTNATLTNSAGLVAYAPMNLLTFSEQFDNAAWIKGSSTIAANTTAAPDGTLTADTLTAAAANSFAYQVFSAAAATYTFSVWIKSVSVGTSLELNLYTNTGASSVGAAVVTTTGSWQRVSVTGTFTSASASAWAAIGGNASFVTGETIYIWGAQLELGSTATTYNPTTVKNLLGYTEHFDNAAWTKSNATISATKVDDIYGQPFAQKLVENTTNDAHALSNNVSVTNGTLYTFSCYAKRAERKYLRLVGATNFVGSVNFDLDDGSFTVTAGTPTVSVTPIGNGWFRCAITAITAATTITPNISMALNSTGTGAYQGDGTSGIYIFGAQLSDSASVDPYVYQPVAAPTSVAYYGPRFDYDPVTLAPKGLLIEEQRSNLLLRSEEFDAATWFKTDATVTANATTSPDGTVDAEKVIVSSGLSSGVAGQSVTKAASAIQYTWSVYAKAGEWNSVGVYLTGISFNNRGAVIVNLATGAISTAANVAGTFTAASATVTDAGNGWYRVALTVTSNTDTAVVSRVYPGNNGAFPNGDGTSGIFVYGAQLEAGSFATSYIPTVASQVTRAADSASMIGNNFARWYNQTEGTVFAQYSVNGLNPGASNAAYGISDNTTANFIAGRTLSSAATNFQVRTGGADQVALNSTSVAAGAVAKSAGAYALNNFAFTANAETAQTDTAGTLPVVTQMQIGGLTSSVNPLNGTISRIAYYNRRLSNTELQGITS